MINKLMTLFSPDPRPEEKQAIEKVDEVEDRLVDEGPGSPERSSPQTKPGNLGKLLFKFSFYLNVNVNVFLSFLFLFSSSHKHTRS
jgi:hypothetical protein